MNLWLRETDPKIQAMRSRLDGFYATTNQYDAFNAVSDQSRCWKPVLDTITDLAERDPSRPVRVLEFGAGRSGFGRFLPAKIRSAVHWTVQDVVDANADFLREEADTVHVGDLMGLSGEFDVVFSTYVWEHVSNPAQTLDVLLNMLSPHGALYLFSPRYDLPFYRPPALRHLSMPRQVVASLLLIKDRVRVKLGGRPGFWITPEPAVLNVDDWFRDADAVHLVSLKDLEAATRGRAVVTSLTSGVAFLQRRLQLRVRLNLTGI